MSLQILGMDKLLSQLRSLGNIDPHDTLPGAEVIYNRSQQLVPVDTGELRDSGYFSVNEEGSEIGYTAPYAPDVEFGTYKMDAEPYLRPAIDEAESEILKAVAEKVQADIIQAVE